MARPPAHHRPWLDFFFGFVRTPRRLGFTLIGAFVLLVFADPNSAAMLLNYIFNNVLLALLPIAIMVAAVLWGFKIMFSPLAPKKKKKRH